MTPPGDHPCPDGVGSHPPVAEATVDVQPAGMTFVIPFAPSAIG